MQKPQIKTVFVIGAGSGYDFSMPLGADLVQKIADDLKNVKSGKGISDLPTLLKDAISTWLEATSTAATPEHDKALLRLSGAIHFAKSIDTLINDANDPNVKAIGKIIISKVINEAEKKVPFLFSHGGINWANLAGDSRQPAAPPNTTIETFTPKDRPDERKDKAGNPLKLSFNQTWFAAFFRELRAGLTPEQFQERLKSTAIINFNYDRLTEHFLTVAHSQYDGITLEQAQSNLAALNHIHPYGILASATKYSENKPESGVAVGSLEKTEISGASTLIKTYDEGTSDEDRVRIETIMRDAQNIVLLGYGFHRQNDKLLGLETTKASKIWATGIGMSEARRALIASRISGTDGSAKVLIQNLNCRELIDEYGDDFFEYI